MLCEESRRGGEVLGKRCEGALLVDMSFAKRPGIRERCKAEVKILGIRRAKYMVEYEVYL